MPCTKLKSVLTPGLFCHCRCHLVSLGTMFSPLQWDWPWITVFSSSDPILWASQLLPAFVPMVTINSAHLMAPHLSFLLWYKFCFKPHGFAFSIITFSPCLPSGLPDLRSCVSPTLISLSNLGFLHLDSWCYHSSPSPGLVISQPQITGHRNRFVLRNTGRSGNDRGRGSLHFYSLFCYFKTV